MTSTVKSPSYDVNYNIILAEDETPENDPWSAASRSDTLEISTSSKEEQIRRSDESHLKPQHEDSFRVRNHASSNNDESNAISGEKNGYNAFQERISIEQRHQQHRPQSQYQQKDRDKHTLQYSSFREEESNRHETVSSKIPGNISPINPHVKTIFKERVGEEKMRRPDKKHRIAPMGEDSYELYRKETYGTYIPASVIVKQKGAEFSGTSLEDLTLNHRMEDNEVHYPHQGKN